MGGWVPNGSRLPDHKQLDRMQWPEPSEGPIPRHRPLLLEGFQSPAVAVVAKLARRNLSGDDPFWTHERNSHPLAGVNVYADGRHLGEDQFPRNG